MSEEKDEYYLAETNEDIKLIKLLRQQVNHLHIENPILFYTSNRLSFLVEEDDAIEVIEHLIERNYSKMTKETLNKHILEMSLGISELW